MQNKKIEENLMQDSEIDSDWSSDNDSQQYYLEDLSSFSSSRVIKDSRRCR